MSSSLTGTLLVASPQITEGLFARSVCLIVHHDHQAVIGLVLNRPLPTVLPQLLAAINGQPPVNSRLDPGPTAANLPVHYGGPLAGPVMALHLDKQLAEAETTQEIYVAAQQGHLQQLIGQTQSPVRLIVGHAGWTNEQLVKELQAGNWYTLPATPDLVFEHDDTMWQRLLPRAAGLAVAKWVAAVPTPNPMWN